MQFALFLAFYLLQSTFCCTTGYFNPTATEGPLFGMGETDHKLYRNPDHWTPENWERSSWTDWYKNWLAEQQNLEINDNKKVEEGWTDYDHSKKPRRWTHLPPGRDAQEPPPWAVIPNNYGKPDFCFQPPSRGDCVQDTYRWGFNPHRAECQQFTYTGCGGNSNNFLSRQRCEEACLNLASSLCQQYGTRRDGIPLLGRPC